jgi:predicted transcriptional regulator
MTAADLIYAHITEHGSATRPELEKKFDLCEKTVDTAIRKLEGLGCIKRSGMTQREWHKRPAVVFVVGDAEVAPELISDTRGRPRIQAVKTTISFDALTNAMNSFFGAPA